MSILIRGVGSYLNGLMVTDIYLMLPLGLCEISEVRMDRNGL